MGQVVRPEFKTMKSWLGVISLLTAAVSNRIVVSVDMSLTAYTIANQPAVPARISCNVTTQGGADTLGTLLVVGTDTDDEVISESITPVAGATVYTTLYFKTVTSVTSVGWVSDGTPDHIVVGVSMDSGISVKGRNVTLNTVSGNICVNPKQTAVYDSTSLKPPTTFEAVVNNQLSIISDGSAATISWVVWKN